jgi:ubiquitin-protein ligase E3 C
MIAHSLIGETVTTELIPGGASIPVTRENRMSYIYRMADHRLNR